jgi:AcrR family transcriptional regulator
MARPKSPEKRTAILRAAAHEIARSGLSAATADIARRAGIASGTLFSYFASKDKLLNELYLELKAESCTRMIQDFPLKASLQSRTWHIWSRYLGWAIDFPQERKVVLQLSISDLITPATRIKSVVLRGALNPTLDELEARGVQRGLPAGFATAAMAAMQEAAMEFIAKQPKDRTGLIEHSFQVYWRAFK